MAGGTQLTSLFETIDALRNWSGTRPELVDLVSTIEEQDPKGRMLHEKLSPDKTLPIKPRRIQWFISENMMPKPSGKRYGFEHLVFYWAVIYLRKQGMTFRQLKNIVDEMNTDQAMAFIKQGNENASFLKAPGHPSSKTLSENISKGLQRLGRSEGRPLESNPLRLSITPWCHVTINESKLDDLTIEDVEVISEALRQSLSKMIENKK